MRRVLWFALALCTARCNARDSPDANTARTPRPCHIAAASACRVGCDADPPKKLVDVAPDLSGLDAGGVTGVVLAEILIDTRGYVQQACVVRGLRGDIDIRVIDAVLQWRFEPVRLRHSTPPRMTVPLVAMVALPIGGG